MKREQYASDLSDEEWAILEPLIPAAKEGGRERTVEMREVVNAIFYLVKSGCSWRMLPHEFPKWPTVYTYFNGWRKSGQWGIWNQELRERVRVQAGHERTPSAGSIDSQSVKTSQKGAFEATMRARK
jgi:putative transposase